MVIIDWSLRRGFSEGGAILPDFNLAMCRNTSTSIRVATKILRKFKYVTDLIGQEPALHLYKWTFTESSQNLQRKFFATLTSIFNEEIISQNILIMCGPVDDNLGLFNIGFKLFT